MKTLRASLVKETEFTYEPCRDAIASVTNRVELNHGQLPSQNVYTANADGHRTARTTVHGDQTFTDAFGYDPDTGGVTRSTRQDAQGQAARAASFSYQYDRIGNRRAASAGEAREITYQADTLKQYTRITKDDRTFTLFHDADGNLLSKGIRTLYWDAGSRLTEIREFGTLIARYTGGHQRRRIARWTRDGVAERHFYQGWNFIAGYRLGEIVPSEAYTWGKDFGGGIQGTGGDGGEIKISLEKRPGPLLNM